MNDQRCEECDYRLPCLSEDKGCLITYGMEICLPLEHSINPFDASSELEEEIVERFHATSPSAGAGFGFRDKQFEFVSQAMAEEALEFTIKFLQNQGYQINDEGEGEAEVHGVYEIDPYFPED